MVPKYCYRVETVYRNGAVLVTKNSNHETLPGAMESRTKALAKQGTIKVSVLCVLDETVKLRGQALLDATFNP
jgi:hypothetical protein